MNIDRRVFLGGAVVVAAGAGGYYVLESGSENASPLPGISNAHAQDADAEKLLQAPTWASGFSARRTPRSRSSNMPRRPARIAPTSTRATFPTLKTDYIDTGKVSFIFREFPLDDLALAAFMLARCAPADKYFPMIDVLFEQQKTWVGNDPREALFKIAKLAGFSQRKLRRMPQGPEDDARHHRDQGARREGVRRQLDADLLRQRQADPGSQSIEDYRKAIEAALAA